nr:sugar ABC transporter permease [Deinobacterium chartae]
MFLAPLLLSLGLFFVYAFLRALYYSFTDYDLFNTPQWVGLRSYLAILADDRFRIALTNTLLFSAVVTTAQTIGALLLAVVLNQKVRGLGFFRSAFYMPSITSSVVITLIFIWLFQRRGVVNYLATQIGAYGPVIAAFIALVVVFQAAQVLWERSRGRPARALDPALLWISVALGAVGVWLALAFGWIGIRSVEPVDISWFASRERLFGLIPIPLLFIMIQNTFTTIPTMMLFFLAGLQNVPSALYEAAELDGASKFQQLRYITVPMLRPVTFYVVTVSLIGTLQMFDQVRIIGSAAPLESIITLAYYVYNNVFPSGSLPRAGMASAAAVILALLTLVIVALQRRFLISDEAHS